MYEIRLLACCFPREEHGKAPNPQTFSKQIDIALRLKPFVTSQVRLSPCAEAQLTSITPHLCHHKLLL